MTQGSQAAADLNLSVYLEVPQPSVKSQQFEGPECTWGSVAYTLWEATVICGH